MSSVKAQGRYQIDMCHGPLLRQIITFTFPLICSSVLQLLFNAADLMVVGRFASHQALAAVGATVSFIHLMINLFVGLSVGANVMVARYIGAKDKVKVSQASQTAILTAIGSGVLLMFIGWLFARPALIWMDTPEDILDKSILYLQIFFIGMPVLMLYNFGSAILRASGDTKRPFYFLLFAGVINVLLNLFFVLVFHWDVAGVAWATVLSQAVSAWLVIRVLTTTRAAFRIRLNKLQMNWKIFREMMYVGIPAGFQSCCFSIANILLQTSLNTFDTQVIAANTAAATIEGMGYMIANSFGQASMNFSSQNLGGKKFDRIRKSIIYAAVGGAIAMLIFSIVIAWLKVPLLSLFTKEPEVIHWGVVRFDIVLPLMFGVGFMEAFISGLRGLGYAIAPTVIMILGVCVFRVIWLLLYFPSHRTFQTLAMTYPISWLLIILMSGFYIFRELRKLPRSAEK